MKTIGMLGGMSWESSAVYYRLINREVQDRLGGVHSAKIVMHSFDFDEVSALQKAGRWDEASAMLSRTGRALALGGADFVMICCNTMHLMADAVEEAARVPLLHIADPLGRAITRAGLTRVGLIGSSYTMTRGGIIKDRLKDGFGIETLIPDVADAGEIDRVIQSELVCGVFTEESRAAYRAIMARLVGKGAQAIVLGCTEIPLLVKDGDAAVPTFDTTTLHALAAVDAALA